MMGLDTNVIVAWIVEGQGRRLPRADLYRISHLVLAEFVWVLSNRFGYARKEILNVLEQLLSASNVVIDRVDIVRAAVSDFAKGGFEFPDLMIAYENRYAGCDSTFTLDRKAARHSAFTMIPN